MNSFPVRTGILLQTTATLKSLPNTAMRLSSTIA